MEKGKHLRREEGLALEQVEVVLVRQVAVHIAKQNKSFKISASCERCRRTFGSLFLGKKALRRKMREQGNVKRKNSVQEYLSNCPARRKSVDIIGRGSLHLR
jgi:hypothetical protein